MSFYEVITNGLFSSVAALPWLIRAVIGAVIGATIFVAAPPLFRAGKPEAPKSSEGTGTNITADHGGVAVGGQNNTVMVYPTPAPASPNVSFQKYALFWVRSDPTHFQLGIIAKLFNLDNQARLIKGIILKRFGWKFIPRGGYTIQKELGYEDHAEIMEDNFIKPSSEGYYKRLLPVFIEMIVHGGGAPDFQIAGEWELAFDNFTLPSRPNFAMTYNQFISPQEWDDLLKPRSQIDFGNLNFTKALTPEAVDSEENQRRNAKVQEFLNDYQNSHDDLPSETDALLQKAESYINQRLAKDDEQFRLEAKTRHLVNINPPTK